MTKPKPKTPETAKAPEVQPHEHDLPGHEHPLPEHEHEAVPYNHEHVYPEPEPHEHPMPSHYHDHEHDVPPHPHHEMRGHVRGAVRGLLALIEAGSVNSEQRKLAHDVRVVLGDAHGPGCAHENTAYEAGDVLVCQDCREVLPSPDAAG